MNLHNWRRITKALTEAEAAPVGPVETREQLEVLYGAVWCSFTLARDYEVEAFCSGCKVVAIRRSDGVRGTLTFQHSPRLYWSFTPD